MVERTPHLTRTASEWNPGWEEWEPTGHGRAWAAGCLDDQGNGEEYGRIKEKEGIGDELVGAGRFERAEKRRDGTVEKEWGNPRLGVWEANGYPPAIVQQHGQSEKPALYHEWDPGLGTARVSDRHVNTEEMLSECFVQGQPDTGIHGQQSIEDEQANVCPPFAWPPPNRAFLERYCASGKSLERLNLQLQRRYSCSWKPSERDKNIVPTPGERSPQAARASSKIQGRAGAAPRRQTPVNNRTLNPATIRRGIHRDGRTGSEMDIAMNLWKSWNEWLMLKRWLHNMREHSLMLGAGMLWKYGASRTTEGFGGRLWDPGGELFWRTSLRGRKHWENGEDCRGTGWLGLFCNRRCCNWVRGGDASSRQQCI